MRDVVLRSSIELDAPPAELWPVLTDTERMNRSLHLDEVRFRSIESSRAAGAGDASPARYFAETTLAGFRVTYDEEPFEFVAPHHYSVRRILHSGPLRQLTTRLTLDPLDDGARTRATFSLEMVLRSILCRPVAVLAGNPVLDGMIEDAKNAVQRAHGEKVATAFSLIDPAHLGRALADLEAEGAAPSTVALLRDLVTFGHDADVVAIRPYELARQHGLEARPLLRSMLLGVKTGLFELRWALICPSCRTFTERVTALEDVPAEGHCQLCDIGYELEMDQSVEATFMVHPGVRRVSEVTFCIGGPARTPHVLVQTNVQPRSSAQIAAPMTGGRYRIFARGGGSVRVSIDPEGATEATVEATDGAKTFSPAEVRVAAGARITVSNATAQARHVKLERFDYANNAVTAAELATMDEFRRLFSADLLKRGTPLKVARVAMFFSDLTGSTALYSRVGDAAAFRIVDDHFDLLRAVIARHDGVMVKTMGDAVMASFHDTRACAAACIEALRGFADFRQQREHGDQIGLKVGMYSGPCYVVTANGVLDYFGQTVNVTSRVQHLASSGELVLTPRDFALLSEEVRAGLLVTERFAATVKGVDTPIDLLRVTLAQTDGEDDGSVQMNT